MGDDFILLCDDYCRLIEHIVWLEALPPSIWGCLELQDCYRREVDLRLKIKALAIT